MADHEKEMPAGVSHVENAAMEHEAELSIYAVWCIIKLGFDTQAGASVLGIPRFREDFGYFYDDSHVLPGQWQSAFNGAPVAMAMIVSFIAAELADRVGRKPVLLMALVVTFGAVAIEFCATTDDVFFVGKFLNGIMVGTIGSVMMSHIGEISSLPLRGVFTSCVGVRQSFGPLVAFIIVNYTGDSDSCWAYRSIFCSQFGVAAVALLFWPFMPDYMSSWWLVSRGHKEKILRALARLGFKGEEGIKRFALTNLTLEENRAETEGVTYM